jgi:hypothetical protein
VIGIFSNFTTSCLNCIELHATSVLDQHNISFLFYKEILLILSRYPEITHNLTDMTMFLIKLK